jgi:large subunit ribosomal protein L25
MIKAQEAEAFYSQILDLVIDGKTEQVTLKALQRHPSRPVILHADFQRVVADKIMNTMIQLHFINEDNAPGVREGGQVTHIMTEVEISCLPGDLPEYIEVDLGNLEMDQTLHLSELKVPAGVEIRLLAQHADDVNASDHDHGVAAIHMPKAAASEEAGDTGAEAGAAEG